MHKRPSLSEALTVLKKLSGISDESKDALETYNIMKAEGEEFLAARIVVDIVDHYYHVCETKGLSHG